MSDHITRVFRSGNSQAVRIPAAYRIDADRVSHRRAGKLQQSLETTQVVSVCDREGDIDE